MTSKRCFFRVMREDFRHKTWMLALSVLGNLLAIPVPFLIMTGDRKYFSGSDNILLEITHQTERIETFFGVTIVISGGIIAVVGALIVGLFGFRYLFRRDMIDTWHSVPVRRRTLFLANWLDGFLIWFVPFLICWLVTLILGESRLGALKRKAEQIQAFQPAGAGILKEALLSALALATAFLVVYHLALLAVMLCGNLLNTLVTVAATGVGALVIWGVLSLFELFYWSTYKEAPESVLLLEKVLYASPLASAVLVLCRRGWEFMEMGGSSSFFGAMVWNLAIAGGLGALALATYERRRSELSEQGICNKPIRIAMQVTLSAVAALGGWIMFKIIVSSAFGSNIYDLAWSVFGALLSGGVVFGTLDVIFNMDFKAFFSHRILMAATLLGSIVIGLSFCFDWMGYDTYLPAEEEIAEIAVSSPFSNKHYSEREEGHPLNRVRITDQAAAGAFLRSAVDFVENGAPEEYRESGEVVYTEDMSVKVTLKNGKSYYRTYAISSLNSEPAYALLTSPEYVSVAYGLGDMEKACIRSMEMGRERQRCQLAADTKEGREIIYEICDACNRDIEENPEAFIQGAGRLLVKVRLYTVWDDVWYLDVYEGMSNMVEALRSLGFGEYVEPVAADKVKEICLDLSYYSRADMSLTEQACRTYGVWPEGWDEGQSEDVTVEDAAVITRVEEGERVVTVTEPAEIEELLGLISYEMRGHSSYVFGTERDIYGMVSIVEKDGNSYAVAISEGALPEKYILRFGKSE